MKKALKNLFFLNLSIFISQLILSCGGGGGSSNPASITAPVPVGPTPPVICSPSYANSNNNQGPLVGIAYGCNNFNSQQTAQVANMAALLLNTSTSTSCSATPIAYNQTTNETWLVSAAHCVIDDKSDSNAITSANFTVIGQGNGTVSSPSRGLYVFNKPIPNYSGAGVESSPYSGFKIKAIYVSPTYCQGATFNRSGSCPIFTYNSAQQSNDITLIRVSGQIESGPYPRLANSIPDINSRILAVGYGLIQGGAWPSPAPQLFYVSEYFFGVSFNPGFYFSYSAGVNDGGYTSLVCAGDSGGGDFYYDGNNWNLVAQHSYGPSPTTNCGSSFSSFPDVSTSVIPYVNWINNIMNNPKVCTNASANCVCAPNVNSTYGSGACS